VARAVSDLEGLLDTHAASATLRSAMLDIGRSELE